MAASKPSAAAKALGRDVRVSFNKVTNTVQVRVPQGASYAEIFKALAKIDAATLAKLPRGCQACLSGHPFDIRETFDPVINVRLRG
ncbi:hypothetical protein [Thermaurantiacus sp.]